MNRTIHGSLRRYGLAAATVALMMFVKTMTDAQIGDGSPLILFLCAVMVTARFAGPGPGVAATVLSVLVCVQFYFLPIGPVKVLNFNDGLRLFVFLVEGLCSSGMMGSLQAAHRAAEETGGSGSTPGGSTP